MSNKDELGRNFLGDGNYRERMSKEMNRDLEEESRTPVDNSGIPKMEAEEPQKFREERNQVRRDVGRAKLLVDLITEGRLYRDIYPFPEHPVLRGIKLTVRSLDLADRRALLVSPRLEKAKSLNDRILLSLDLMVEELAWAIIRINDIDVSPPRVVAELRELNKEVVEYLYNECIEKINREISDSIIESMKAKGLLGNSSGGA